MQAGVRCTISTDDPLVFANTINGEYLALATEAGFTRTELARLARNGWDAADVPESTRARMVAEIDRIAAGSGK
jgi:adenosine deaminase